METKYIDPVILSKYVIYYLNSRGQEVCHLKLQKLLYYLDAFHNAYFKKPLIRQQFEAWMHGPVVREVWDHFKELSILNTILGPEEHVTISSLVTTEQLEVINDILDEYGDKTAYYLECLTHSEDPWKRARRGYAPTEKCEGIISKAYMRKYYKQMLYGEE